MRLSVRERRVGILFVLPAVAYFLSVYYYPLIQSILLSFFDWSTGQTARFIGLDAYSRVLGDPMFWGSVKNTLYFIVLSVPPTVILGLLTAILLNFIRDMRVRNTLSAIYFLPLVMSLVAAALIWGWLYQPVYGLINFFFAKLGLPKQEWPSPR